MFDNVQKCSIVLNTILTPVFFPISALSSFSFSVLPTVNGLAPPPCKKMNKSYKSNMCHLSQCVQECLTVLDSV